MALDALTSEQSTRDHLLRLARGGAGWHPYALDRAQRLTNEDPSLHEGLTAALEAEIGPKDMAAARRALSYFSKTRSAHRPMERT